MATQYGFGKIATDGLVLCLDAGNPRSYSSGSTTWFDMSGNGNSGSLVNGPAFTGSNGGAIVFNGTNQYTDCGSSSLLNFGTGNFTICSWFKTNASIRATILSRFDYNGTGAIERGYYMDILATGKIRVSFELNGSNYRIADSLTSVNTNTYFYGCFTRTDSTTANVYVNGIFESSNTLILGTPSSIDAVTASFTISRRSDYQTPSFSNYFPGNVSQVQIYNRALSAQEILQNYNATKTRFGL